MKTFKLVSLEVVEDSQQEIDTDEIPLLDGLIINREDDDNQWLIEAYLEKRYWHQLQNMEDNSKLMVYAKISKPTNSPAAFLCEIIGINEINDNINVLFIGTLVDQKKDKVENMLKMLIDEGYQGDQLLNKFKKEI